MNNSKSFQIITSKTLGVAFLLWVFILPAAVSLQTTEIKARVANARQLVNIELDGILGIWIKDAENYAAYGGESINLKKYREAILTNKSSKSAAFETVTGGWAKAKGFENVQILEDRDLTNEVIVLFKK